MMKKPGYQNKFFIVTEDENGRTETSLNSEGVRNGWVPGLRMLLELYFVKKVNAIKKLYES